jgi:D-3-phosphoglycerate dehydrogenase
MASSAYPPFNPQQKMYTLGYEMATAEVSSRASARLLKGRRGMGDRMRASTKRVFYVKYLAHNIYAKLMESRSDVRLDKLENDSADDLAAPILAAAHAYQIGSARDELAPKYLASRDLLRRAPRLLIVSTNGAGYDTVDLEACTEFGVLVINQAGGNREAVAEHVLGMMLTLSKRIVEIDRAMRRGAAINRNAFMGRDLTGKTIGIIGLGNVGRRVAELCRGAFSMRVVAYDPYVSAADMQTVGAEKATLEAVMRQGDFVSVNCPLTAESRGMIGAAQYAQMKSTAYFITTARGNIHDETALAAALWEKRIAGAGLDVWEKEPPPPDHPLLAFDNVLVSTHTAGVTHEARVNMGRMAAQQVLAALDGEPVGCVLNAEVWSRYASRFKETFGFEPGAR